MTAGAVTTIGDPVGTGEDGIAWTADLDAATVDAAATEGAGGDEGGGEVTASNDAVGVFAPAGPDVGAATGVGAGACFGEFFEAVFPEDVCGAAPRAV